MAAGSVAAVLGVAAGVWAIWFRGGGPSQNLAAERNRPRCSTGRVPGSGLGRLAWADGSLHLFDLDTCVRRTLVREGASPPVRFSPDGKWVAFGRGTVVPAEGGRPQRPLGAVRSWSWAPGEDELVGVRAAGQVLVGPPDGEPEAVFPGGAREAVFSPDGQTIALALRDRLVVVSSEGGRPSTLFTTGRTGSPKIAGWAPGGRWVLFWVVTPGKPSAPLHASPLTGGGYTNVFDPVLPYADFVSWCGSTLAVSGGGTDLPSEGQQVLISEPPEWDTRNLSADFRSSWLWPSCSPNGAWIAVTATPNGPERPPGYGTRSLWLISRDGGRRVRLDRATHFAFEAPRWSSDGRFVMAVRRGKDPKSPGTVVLYRIDPTTGKVVKTLGSVSVLGPAPGARGHTDWTSVSDWYRP